MESDGADARRWYLTSSALLSGGDLAIPLDGSAIGQSLRTAVLPLWNAYSCFSLYANIDEIELEADIPAGAHRFDYDLDGRALTIAVARVE